MNNHATGTDTNHCPECAMARDATIEAHRNHARAWRQYRDASNAFFTDTANGLLLLGSHACEQRWHEVELLWHEAQTRYEAWMDAHRIHIHTVCAHHQLQKAAEMDEDTVAGDGAGCACAMCTTLDKDGEDTDTKPTPAERAAYFEARDHADDTDTQDAPGRRTAVRIVAYDAHKGGCHEVDPTDVPVWLLDTPNTAIARDVRQATLQEIRTLIDDLIDGPGERGEGES
ncbi:hypothetical protein AALA26_02025 [Bifidobacterium pseudolongum]|uniref:Uncharacterized protein n=1 Tax=Bifidobacterium pseudolongum TaxID=1694 RepID=A0AB37P0C6_9BIFI|nr:hypothetical protein [Bifidobacterium pseudolongum]NBH69569.1 hypothetical protein [Bifidobacterium pseudolongum]RKI88808.1 hypothetical protein D7V89_00115 [Bifidobacterium pseudolongum]RKI88854.1 hypothetical protein D7V89_00360 [Bifidobacterium pseudolongum]